MCVCVFPFHTHTHTKPISTLPAAVLMTGINNTARSDLQFLRGNVQNGLCSTSLLPPPPRHFILFLSPLTNPPSSPSASSRSAVETFVLSGHKRDGCTSKLEAAERIPRAWYQTSDLAPRHRGGRSSGDSSRARRPNLSESIATSSTNAAKYTFTLAEI